LPQTRSKDPPFPQQRTTSDFWNRYIETDLNLDLAKIRPEVNHYFTEAPPMKRMGLPKDIAGGLVYLLSDVAAYVTGHNLAIDSGMSTGNGLTQ
jgi:NAD(P)-dependent dehydrogenase (short-subunit alcohol dehydrogenase family)